jgi:hypothetical protein
MQLRPGEHESQLAASQAAVDHLERVDPNLRAALRMSRMEMRWTVVLEEHGDRYPEEAADVGTPRIVCRSQRLAYNVLTRARLSFGKASGPTRQEPTAAFERRTVAGFRFSREAIASSGSSPVPFCGPGDASDAPGE